MSQQHNQPEAHAAWTAISGHLAKTADVALRHNTFVAFVLLVVASSFVSDAFLTKMNIFNLLRQVSQLGIVSMGMLLVILTAGIDLSVGSVLCFGCVLSAFLLQDMSLAPAIALTILAGAALGSVSGFLVTTARMAPFIATLAMMSIAKGLAYKISKGSPIMLTESGEGLRAFGSGYVQGIPQPVILMFAVFIMVMLVLRYTAFGRLVVAVGSNETAVRLSGVPVGAYKFLVYVICGGLSAMAGLISTARTGVGSPLVGVGLELEAIAAVVVGGASLSGGKGTAANTLLGVLVLGMIKNIMNIKNVNPYDQMLITGLIIISAVLLQGIRVRSDRS